MHTCNFEGPFAQGTFLRETDKEKKSYELLIRPLSHAPRRPGPVDPAYSRRPF